MQPVCTFDNLTLLPTCTDYLEIWEPQPPRTPRPVQACTRIVLLFYRALTTMGNTRPTQHHIP
jgi:hypothetical protein